MIRINKNYNLIKLDTLDDIIKHLVRSYKWRKNGRFVKSIVQDFIYDYVCDTSNVAFNIDELNKQNANFYINIKKNIPDATSKRCYLYNHKNKTLDIDDIIDKFNDLIDEMKIVKSDCWSLSNNIYIDDITYKLDCLGDDYRSLIMIYNIKSYVKKCVGFMIVH